MKPEQEEKLDKAVTQSTSSLEKIGEIDRKLESLEAGLKELADAFRKFSEGFARSFTPLDKRIARTNVTVSKEDDGRRPAGGGRGHAEHSAQSDADAGFLEAMKSAHSNPTLGA